MPRFQIDFSTIYYGENEEGTGSSSRVIEAKNKEEAALIADAMIGEEVYSSEYLRSVRNVEETDRELSPIAYTKHHADHVWNRVRNFLMQNKAIDPGKIDIVRMLHQGEEWANGVKIQD